MRVTPEQIDAWLEKPEGEHLEFKEAKSKYDVEKLLQYCSALANEGGGRLVLGVTDKRPRRVLGSAAFKSPEKMQGNLTAALHIRVDVDEVAHRSGRVIVFTAPPRPLGMPIRAKGVPYMRVGESLVPMTDDRLKRIYAETGLDYSAEICIGATLDDLSPKAIDYFRNLWADKVRVRDKNLAEKLLEKPIPQLLADAELVSGGGVTFAALILLGTEPALTRHIGQAEVVFEYRAEEKNIDFQDREAYREGILLLINKVWEKINLRNNLYSFQEGAVRRQIPTFNETAVRESVLNAVCHRDYRFASSVWIRQYVSKLEVESPGGFIEGITAADILSRQAPRNRRIAEALEKCGLVERSGQGVDRMEEIHIREGKARPSFAKSTEFQVTVILDGAVRDPELMRYLRKKEQENIELSARRLKVVHAVRNDQTIDLDLQTQAAQLLEQKVLKRVEPRSPEVAALVPVKRKKEFAIQDLSATFRSLPPTSRAMDGAGASPENSSEPASGQPQFSKPELFKPQSSKPEPSEELGRLAEIAPGTIFAERYRIGDLIGRGGMGVVYRADDMDLGISVALKLMPQAYAQDLVGELKAARLVTHPYVCRVYDLVTDPAGASALAMEYIEGETLTSFLKRGEHLSLAGAVELGRQICSGLEAVHEAGLVHGDLKPLNVMIRPSGQALITDFGLAEAVDSAGIQKRGTPAYMAPERFDGVMTKSGDIYALGLILYELFTSRPAFSGKYVEDLRQLHVDKKPPPFRQFVEDFPPALEEIVLACLAKVPEERPQSALEVSKSLRWLPMPGESIPGTEGWVLEEKLGGRGSAEIWLAVRGGGAETEKNVFKFFLGDRAAARMLELEPTYDLLRRSGREDFVQLIHRQTEKSPRYFQLEHAELGNLAEWLERQASGLPLWKVLRIGRKIALALEAAHEMGIVHGDLHPANILVTGDDPQHPQIQLIDFWGGQRSLDGEAPSSGSWLHRAPELLDDSSPSTQVDVYCLGIILFQLAIGSFRKTVSPGWTEELDSDLLKSDLKAMLAANPNDRPDASQVVTWLETFEERERKLIFERARRERSRFFRATLLTLVLLVSSLGGSLYLVEEAKKKEELADSLKSSLGLIIDSFEAADPASLSNPGGADVTVREVLDINVKLLRDGQVGGPRARVPLLNAFGDIYRRLGLYDKSEPLIEEALKLSREHFGEKSPEVAESLSHKGLLMSARNRYSLAEQLFYEALEIRRLESDSSSEELAEVLSHLAEALQNRGSYTQAEELSRQALEIRQGIFDAEATAMAEIRVASSLNSLANILKDRGRFEESKELFEKTLEIRQRRLGNHPQTADTLDGLADALVALGRLQKAETLLKESLEIVRALYPEEHPRIVAGLNNLGTILHFQGEFDQARELFDQAMAAQVKIIGEAPHLETASILINIAFMDEVEGRLDDAEAGYRKALAMQTEILGDQHRDIATTLTFLGGLLMTKGDYGESDRLFREAEAIQSSVLEDESGDRAQTLNAHGLLLRSLGRYGEAQEKFSEALQIYERVLTEEDLALAEVTNNLALLLDSTGQYKQAEPLYRKALASTLSKVEQDHPQVATIKNNLAFVLVELGDFYLNQAYPAQAELAFAEARDLLEEALEIERTHWGEESLAAALVLKNLGFLAEKEGNFSSADESYEESLRLRSELLGPDHFQVGLVLSSMARSDLSRGDVEKAEAQIRRAINILRSAFPEGHWRIANAEGVWGACLSEKGSHDEAEALLLRSYSTLKSAKGETSFYVRDALRRIIRLYELSGEDQKADEYRELWRRSLAEDQISISAADTG